MSTYPGFLNSSYVPQKLEISVINNPGGILGPWLLATVFCLMMEGVVLCQTFTYVSSFPNDRWLTRSLVYVTTILCTLKAGHMLYISWDFFVAHFGNYRVVGLAITRIYFQRTGQLSTLAQAATISTSTKITTLESSIIGAIVQLFFIHRAFILSRNWVVLALTIPTLIIGLAGALSFTVLSFTVRSSSSGSFSKNRAAYMMLSCVVACDIFITGFTCWYLLRAKSGFSTTNNIISRLLTTAIQSAAPPTICAILNLYFNSQTRSNVAVNTFNALMPFFYVSSMIFALNARSSISRGGTGVSSTGANAYASFGGGQTADYIEATKLPRLKSISVAKRT
ncbi:hypothetical protein BDV93DRAFT_556930 [Ceratobasidium sp. AG-I]|nr:hypothetical protein BDV93DRAFT_556930 [Ceratobasidium sp. AG-I]